MDTSSFGNRWEGRVVEGKFPLLEWLGGAGNCGTFLTVLPGFHEGVIQLIATSGAEADTYVTQWDFTMGLSHPHLTQVFAAGRCVMDQTELVYVVTERSYTTLAKIIQSDTLKVGQAREVFSPVLNALSYLHANDVVHGFVNPSNILLADLKPKLSVTNLLVAGSATRSVPKHGDYGAPELRDGEVTAAADIWSFGMTLFETLTRSQLSWDSSGNEDPEITGSLSSPFLEIVRDCLRVDPLQRCTVQTVLERMDECKSIPLSECSTPVEIDRSVREETPVLAVPTPISNEPRSMAPQEQEIRVADSSEDSSQPVYFSKSLASLEEAHSTRFRLWALAVLLAVFAFGSVLWVRAHKTRTPSAVASESAPIINKPEVHEPAPVAAPPAANPAPAEAVPPAVTDSEKVKPDDVARTETPTTSEDKPAPPSRPVADETRTKGNTVGRVAKRVMPSVAPGARSAMREPVEVILRVSVNQNGKVSNASYVSPGPGNYFARIARGAATSWEFTPPTLNGDPQPSIWTVLFYFERQEIKATATEDKK